MQLSGLFFSITVLFVANVLLGWFLGHRFVHAFMTGDIHAKFLNHVFVIVILALTFLLGRLTG